VQTKENKKLAELIKALESEGMNNPQFKYPKKWKAVFYKYCKGKNPK
jgi:hypothetical protein